MFKQNISFDVWGGDAGKYRLRDGDNNPLENTPEETCDRVAKALSECEVDKKFWFKEFRNILGTKFAGGGRIMANIGAGIYKKETSPINCTVMRQIPDSMAGIMQVASEAALTLKAGSGTGYDFSTIRPKGSYVFGAGAETSGVISFMRIFDAICSTVMSGGSRRGAQMGCLDVSSPEIEDFIVEKRKNGALRYFNLSVLITDSFMNAVEQDQDWKLWFWKKNKTKNGIKPQQIKLIKKDDIPYSYPEYEYFSFAKDHNEVIYGNCTTNDVFAKVIYKTIKAKYLFNLIIKSTYEFWEPGFILIDRANKENNLYFCETIRATNPCQPAWSTVLTPSGISTIGDVNVGDMIWSGSKWTKIINKWSTGIKKVNAYRTRAGTFYGTENHKVVSGGLKIEAKYADSIDLNVGTLPLEKSQISQEQRNLAIMDGLVIGDGTTHKATSLSKAFLIIGENDQDYFNSEIKDLIIAHRPGIKPGTYDVKTSITNLAKTYERSVPNKYKFDSFDEKCAFLRGLYSANGSIVANRVTLKASSFKIIEDVQIMLSSIGISSYYTVNKAHTVEFSNGAYECKESYDLSIGQLENRKKFAELIGFIQNYKNEKLTHICYFDSGASRSVKMTYDIVEKEFISEEEVYDITVEADEHTYWTGGLLVSNCGEQPLAPLTSCLLGSMILAEYVVSPFENASFNLDAFATDVRIANRLLDNVVELNNLPLPELKDQILLKRRHGLGFTGVGSVFNMLEMAYGSQESLELLEKISYTLAKVSLLTNIELAKEKGCAPIFKKLQNRKAVLKSQYLSRLINSLENKEEIIADILKYGLRYSHATTIAPNGTLSMTWGNNCSNGIEPVYLNSNLRNIRKHNKKTKVQEKVMDYSFFLWKEKYGNKVLPAYWRTTNNLSVKDHLMVQAVVQKWCDSSISKTINVPADYSFEDFKNVYMDGWKLGLKGVTTYKPNASISSGVLTSEEELDKTDYIFTLEDGTEITLNGNDTVEYDGETHNAANLFDALKEGIYGNM